jgi:hypothetical protein
MTETLIPPIEESRADVDRLDLRTRMFVDGAFRDAVGGGRYVTENPATGQPITEVAQGGPADVDIAVAVARKAADDGRWSRLDPGARKRILIDWANLIETHARELGLIETIDAGKPITDTVGLDMPETTAPASAGTPEAAGSRTASRAVAGGDCRHDHARAVWRRRGGHLNYPPRWRPEARPRARDRQHRGHWPASTTSPSSPDVARARPP